MIDEILFGNAKKFGGMPKKGHSKMWPLFSEVLDPLVHIGLHARAQTACSSNPE